MISSFNQFINEGCGRCDRYKTPHCSVHQWSEIIIAMREIALDSGLTEVIKWSQPCYTYKGRNILMISALKEHASLSFFQGFQLLDQENLLVPAGKHSRIAKLLKIMSLEEVVEKEKQIRAFIQEAMRMEDDGKLSISNSSAQALPAWPNELSDVLNRDQEFKKAFISLTLGRQRGYLIHFLQAKQSATRLKRIHKYRSLIMEGKGMHDHYGSK